MRFKYYRYATTDGGIPKKGFVRYEDDVAVFDRMLSEAEIRKHGLEDLNAPVKKITRLRVSSGLKQSDLAEMTGIGVRTIREYEKNGTNGAPFRNVVKLAKALHCNVMDLAEYNEKGELE